MYKTLAHRVDRDEIAARLGSVRPDSPRQWGRMTADQMLCHLSDSCRAALGIKHLARRDNRFTRTVVKWFALWGPLPWTKGIPTAPEVDQMGAGTQPSVFEHDMSELRALLQRVIDEPDLVSRQSHSMFGRMTHAEWLRWAYLPADHHLRQFGA
ncbi:MAG: hypothetical protein NTY02_04965 [Acidobacteria bacterium]|nr:hypothetical protein [Acidobacteriota bacterium]